CTASRYYTASKHRIHANVLAESLARPPRADSLVYTARTGRGLRPCSARVASLVRLSADFARDSAEQRIGSSAAASPKFSGSEKLRFSSPENFAYPRPAIQSI
ncbi:MAG: hypothetical protein AAB633_01140, partial [Patescibacteria group bacterium]